MAEPVIEDAMRRALELAGNGPERGVNPRVGCVILSADGRVLAEGWHRGAGTAHAEIDALQRLASAEDARGATVVVTLEPCNHVGRTGPCTEALIDAGIARVIYGVDDPGAGCGGAARLRAAGIDVISGVLRETGEEFLGDWLTAARLGRPRVTLKWAASLDGRVAASDGSSRWVTGEAARRHVHAQRAAHDAILVGTGTLLADDPSLTARGDGGELLLRQPIPVIVGDRPIPAGAAVRRHPNSPIQLPGHDLPAALRLLGERGIRSVYVEGGPTIASALVTAGLVDDYHVYLAPLLLGGPRLALGDLGVPDIAAGRRLAIDRLERLGNDLFLAAHEVAAHDRDEG